MQLLTCPAAAGWVAMDEAGFRAAVEHDRCPLAGVGLEPSEWVAASGGVVVRRTVGRCDPGVGGCGAEWAPLGEVEVECRGSGVQVDFPDDDVASTE